MPVSTFKHKMNSFKGRSMARSFLFSCGLHCRIVLITVCVVTSLAPRCDGATTTGVKTTTAPPPAITTPAGTVPPTTPPVSNTTSATVSTTPYNGTNISDGDDDPKAEFKRYAYYLFLPIFLLVYAGCFLVFAVHKGWLYFVFKLQEKKKMGSQSDVMNLKDSGEKGQTPDLIKTDERDDGYSDTESFCSSSDRPSTMSTRNEQRQRRGGFNRKSKMKRGVVSPSADDEKRSSDCYDDLWGEAAGGKKKKTATMFYDVSDATGVVVNMDGFVGGKKEKKKKKDKDGKDKKKDKKKDKRDDKDGKDKKKDKKKDKDEKEDSDDKKKKKKDKEKDKHDEDEKSKDKKKKDKKEKDKDKDDDDDKKDKKKKDKKDKKEKGDDVGDDKKKKKKDKKEKDEDEGKDKKKKKKDKD